MRSSNQGRTGDALTFFNDEDMEITNRYPGEFAPTANAHALEEACFSGVQLRDGADRVFLDSPKAEWLWEFAEANDIVVHIHPPMQSDTRCSCNTASTRRLVDPSTRP
jgi:predicted TIM-barrel fold metal-dependent hydrolase